MRPVEVKSYAPACGIGKVVVLKPANGKFKEGDVVVVGGACPTEEYYSLLPAVNKIDKLGMPALTAYSTAVSTRLGSRRRAIPSSFLWLAGP